VKVKVKVKGEVKVKGKGKVRVKGKVKGKGRRREGGNGENGAGVFTAKYAKEREVEIQTNPRIGFLQEAAEDAKNWVLGSEVWVLGFGVCFTGGRRGSRGNGN